MGNSLRSASAGQRYELLVDTPGRLDAVIAAAASDLSRGRVQRLIDSGLVEVNGQPARKATRVEPGDLVSYHVPEVDRTDHAAGLSFDVLYEDADVIVIDKPAGVAVHTVPDDGLPNIADWFAANYIGETRGFDADRPGIVHRLDKDTSGVLVLARTPQAQEAVSAAFQHREVLKTYVAITEGIPPRERALIDAPIGRHPGDRTRMIVSRKGREARTSYHTVATAGDRALVEAHPETGRTHQIRVHLAAVGTPVTADWLYGTGGEGRQWLHAWRITVPHPDGAMLTVTSPLPADMRNALHGFGFGESAMQYCQPVEPQLIDPAAPPID